MVYHNMSDYKKMWEAYYEKQNSRRIRKRCMDMKEYIVAGAFHPKRIQRILELGGYDALDNIS